MDPSYHKWVTDLQALGVEALNQVPPAPFRASLTGAINAIVAHAARLVCTDPNVAVPPAAVAAPEISEMDIEGAFDPSGEKGKIVREWNLELVIYTDGSCHPNPGPCGWGIVVFDADGTELHSSSHAGEVKGTNNYAEYKGVIQALEFIREMKIDASCVEIRSDSQLVVKQLTGAFRVGAKLKPLFDEAKAVLEEIGDVIFKFVSGVDNKAHEYAERGQQLARSRLGDK
jgi:ribonuclease HI